MTASEALEPQVLYTDVREVSTPVDTLRKLLGGENGRFHCLMATLGITLALLVSVLFKLERISVINLHPIGFAFQCAIPMLAIVAYCHWAGFGKLRDGC